MLDIRKWNYKTKEYDSYVVNPSWKVVLVTYDMNLKINCTQNGEEILYGDSYTSLEIHDSIGFGYPVCDKCYGLELDREKEAKQ